MDRTLTERDRTIAARLIDLYNGQYEKIFMAAQRRGRDEVLRRDVAAFFSGSTGLAELFRGFAVGDDGKMPRERVLQNLERIQASQKFELLRHGLSELLDFMLFSAMEAMERRDERELERRTQAILEEAGVARDRPARGASIGVKDLGGSVSPLVPSFPPYPLESPAFDDALEPRSAQPSDVAPMSPSEQAPVIMVPYLPDAQADEFASGLRACRSDATLALERAEQIASLVWPVELREIALRCAEHAAAVIRALDELDQHVARLRRR